MDVSEDASKRLRQLAQKYGQDINDADMHPEQQQAAKIRESQRILRSRPNGTPNRGVGNSEYDVIEFVDSLVVEGVVDWQEKLRAIFNYAAKFETKLKMSKRRIGAGQDIGSPYYDAPYLRVKEIRNPKISGLTQVFFLVDSSGSMYVNLCDGTGMFDYIFSEIIELERQCDIKYSGLAYYCTAPLREDQIHLWDRTDVLNPEDILSKIQFRKGDQAQGGTDVSPAFNSLLDLEVDFKPVIDKSTNHPTILIIISDGGDDYSKIQKICEKHDFPIDAVVFLIVSDAGTIKAQYATLSEQGLSDDHYIGIDITNPTIMADAAPK